MNLIQGILRPLLNYPRKKIESVFNWPHLKTRFAVKMTWWQKILNLKKINIRNWRHLILMIIKKLILKIVMLKQIIMVPITKNSFFWRLTDWKIVKTAFLALQLWTRRKLIKLKEVPLWKGPISQIKSI